MRSSTQHLRRRERPHRSPSPSQTAWMTHRDKARVQKGETGLIDAGAGWSGPSGYSGSASISERRYATVGSVPRESCSWSSSRDPGGSHLLFQR